MDQWLKFFLTGVIEISKKGVETFDGVLQLQRILENKLQSPVSRGNESRKVIDYLYSQPITDALKIGRITGKSKATNYKLLYGLERLILKEVTGAQRNKLYVFSNYLALFKNE